MLLRPGQVGGLQRARLQAGHAQRLAVADLRDQFVVGVLLEEARSEVARRAREELRLGSVAASAGAVAGTALAQVERRPRRIRRPVLLPSSLSVSGKTE